MKTSYFLIAILAIALGFTSYKLASQPSDRPTEKTSPDGASGATARSIASSDPYQAIMTRTSVRAYSDRKVGKHQIDSLLHAAMAAPTAMNKQPWSFVVINDRQILDSIAANCPNIKMAAEAPVAIAVCGDMNLAIEGNGRDYWIQDCSAATENLLVAANAMGLGAVWCGIYPIPDRVKFISDLLGLPESIVPLNIIPIGYPNAATSPKDKFDAKRIHTNRF